VDACIPHPVNNDNCWVHRNSGVGNYWFYLLSQGGSGTNDLGNAFNITGIGITKASKIVYKMAEDYLVPASTYPDARTASITAAEFLYLDNSCEEMAVTNAWYAVWVGEKFQYSNVTSSGPSFVCSSGAIFTVNNMPPGCSPIWTPSDNLTLYSASGNSATFIPKGTSTGNGSVQVSLSYTCGTSIPINTVNVFVGCPTPSISATKISGTGEPTEYRFTTIQYTNATYSWYVNNVLQQSGTSNTFEWYFPCNVSKTIKCKLTNGCGTSGFSNSITKTGGCNKTLSYSVSPNPATSTVTLSAVSPKTVVDSTEITYSSFDFVRVYDFQGNLKKSLKYSKANSVSINIADLNGGGYIFEIGTAEYAEKHQVMVNK
jgi:bacillolysin